MENNLKHSRWRVSCKIFF